MATESMKEHENVKALQEYFFVFFRGFRGY